MKKLKRPFEWEERKDSSKGVGLESKDAQDEEVIDLEDIVELGSKESYEDEEFDFDVEILDVDSDDGEEALGPGLPAGEEEKGAEEDEDILKKFSFAEAGESVKAVEPEPKEEEEPDLFDFEMEETKSETVEENPDLGVPEALQEEAVVVAAAAAEAPKPEVEAVQPQEAPQEPEPSAEAAPALDEIVAQLENRLLQAVREMVDSRLPEIVRAVLREEIERLQKELQ